MTKTAKPNEPIFFILGEGMTTIQTAKQNEPIFFILSDANTYFRVELADDRLIVTCDNFAWGPQRICLPGDWPKRN